MEGSTARVLTPTPEQIEAAGKELYNELVKTEKQPLETMSSIEEVFAELDKKFYAKFQSHNN